ncbi:MAG: class I SAM-dependent methyltransferase [Gammaproteobacteria bacterium]|jgi:cyclopropane-fatty-acyl-phospholipid synthase
MKDAASSITAPRRAFPSVARAALGRVGSRVQSGTLVVETPDGETLTFSGREDAQHVVHWHLKSYQPLWALLSGGATAFAETYLDGEWTTPDLAALIRFAIANEQHFGTTVQTNVLTRMAARLQHRLRANSRSQARRNIAHHYDLGNEFYRHWLDETMTYSAALYANENDTLETAQTRKYARLADIAGVKDGDEVLEIGCGWGGFIDHAASRFDARITGVSISNAQLEYAASRIRDAGLAAQAQVENRDYRDIEGRYDRIVSIEMFEAVGEAYWLTYARKLKALLKSGGAAALQVITIEETRFDQYRREPDFIQKYIFPGGMLPSYTALARTFERAGLRVTDRFNFGRDYARTLDAWRQRFDAAWPQIDRLGFDARFQRMWHFYLGYCEAGFREDSIDVVQVRLEHA